MTSAPNNEAMTDDPEATHERAAIQHMMRRLDGFAEALGMDKAIPRQIVDQVLTDMAMRTEDERLVAARMRMVAAAMA